MKCKLVAAGIYLVLAITVSGADEKAARFNSVDEAWQAWSSGNQAAKTDAFKYLESQIRNPQDPASFLKAWRVYSQIQRDLRDYAGVIKLATNALQAGLDTDAAPEVLAGLSDSYAGQEKWPEALKARMTILEKYRANIPGAVLKTSIATVASLHADRLNQPNKAIEFLNKELSLAADDKPLAADILGWIAYFYGVNLKDRNSSEAAYRKIIALDKAISPTIISETSWKLGQSLQEQNDVEGMKEVLLGKNRDVLHATYVQQGIRMVAQTYATRLNQPKQAIDFLNKELARTPADNPLLTADIIGQIGAIYQLQLNDSAGAEASFKKIVDMSLSVQPAQVGDAASRLAQILYEKGDAEGAANAALCGIKLGGLPGQRLLDIHASDAKLLEGVEALRDRVVVASTPPWVTVPGPVNADAYQSDIVRLLVAANHKEEAVQEARAWLNACSPQSIPQAMELVTYAFKSGDGNLSRANAFLRFQKYGPAGEDKIKGTADDVEDELRKIPPIQDANRKARWERVIATVPADWAGYRGRATIYFYMDDPARGFEALRQSFELCPMNEQALQSVADSITRFVVMSTRDVSLAERLIGFMMYGYTGKDGKTGTADDTIDPTLDILKQAGLSVPQDKVVVKSDAGKAAAALSTKAE